MEWENIKEAEHREREARMAKRKEEVSGEAHASWIVLGAIVDIWSILLWVVGWLMDLISGWSFWVLLVWLIVVLIYTGKRGDKAKIEIANVVSEEELEINERRVTVVYRCYKALLIGLFVAIFGGFYYLLSSYEKEVVTLNFLIVYFWFCFLILRFLWRRMTRI